MEYACLFYASSTRPTIDEALDKACSQYLASSTHDAVISHFLAPFEEYSIVQFTEFICNHRLT
jgi:hypothetical protein